MKLSAMKLDLALTEHGDRAENIPDLLGIRSRRAAPTTAITARSRRSWYPSHLERKSVA
jgi:hypothetical protein